MFSPKNLFLILAAVNFLLIAGAGLYEHVAAVPGWAAAPPRSLSMFQGSYGLNPGLFWRSIHPLCLLLFVAALISNWKTTRRKIIAGVLVTYILILVTTAIYFVPELISITTTPFQNDIDPALASRAGLWEKLSIGRLIIILLLAIGLLSALTNPGIKPPHNHDH